LTTWRAERRATAATVERGNAFSDDLESPSIRAVQAIYSAATLEELKMFQVVDRLVELFQTGKLPLGRGEGARRLHQYGDSAARRLPARERHAIYQRTLGIGAEAGIESNREFSELWLRFLSAATSGAGGDPGADQEALRKAGQELAGNLSLHGYGIAYVAATELQSQMRDMIDVLSDRDIQSAFGSKDMWQVIDTVAARYLGGAANSGRLRALQASGATVLRWLAAKADELSHGSAGPILDIGERGAAKGPGAPTDCDLVQAAERWLEASG
jgi:hypothetical protein